MLDVKNADGTTSINPEWDEFCYDAKWLEYITA